MTAMCLLGHETKSLGLSEESGFGSKTRSCALAPTQNPLRTAAPNAAIVFVIVAFRGGDSKLNLEFYVNVLAVY